MKCNSRTLKKYDKDAIFNAVVARMTAKGKGFFIISCGAWIHPENTVLNCYAIMFDGFIQYKFQWSHAGFTVAEIRSTHWFELDVKAGDLLTHEQLIQKIKDAK